MPLEMTEEQLRRTIQDEIRRSGAGKELPSDPADFDITQFLHGAGWTKRNMRFGVATVSWPATGSMSNVITVTHGMMIAPTVVIATAIANTGEGAGISCTVVTITATTFNVYLEYVNGFWPGIQNRAVHWIAIR